MEQYNNELYHHGVKGMKWGVRRTAEQLGNKISKYRADHKNKREHVKELKKELKSVKTGNKITEKNGEVLTRKQFKGDDPVERKRRIDADMKEADDRVKYYGSKRAAKAAIQDEAEYAKSSNRGKAFINTLLYGGSGALAGTTIMTLAANTAAAAAVGAAAPLVGVGIASAAAARKANMFIDKHAKAQLLYTDDSEYGHDMVITFKKHD